MPPQLQLDQLRCPQTGGELTWMSNERLKQLRQAVAAARVVNRGGDLVTQPPDAALLCPEAALAYPVVHGIPVLVPDEAIAMSQIGDRVAGVIDENATD